MQVLKDSEIIVSDLLDKISSFRVSEGDLVKDFEISEGTLRAYKKNKEKISSRASLVQMKLIVLESALKAIHQIGYKGREYETLKALSYEGRSIFNFINTYASNPLAKGFVVNVIEKELGYKFNKSAIDSFREKYEYLNDETLLKATAEVPELLVKMVEDSDLRPSTRGDILQAIAYGARTEYFEFVRSQIGHDSPFIREAAMLALFSYYRSNDKYSFLKGELIKLLESEKAEGVRKTLEELLEEMD